MNELEVRMRIHALVKDMIYDFMAKNGVGAPVMVDALNAVLVGLYPIVQGEMLRAIDMETAAKARQQAQAAEQINPAEQKAAPKEKEVK